MRNTNRKYLKFSLALAFTGLFIAADLAVAQDVQEEIVVRSPIERTEARIPIGSSVTTQTVELNRYVNIAGLDLTNEEDVEILDAQISELAKESCEKLSEMFPLDRSDRTEIGRCIEKTIAYANKQKKKIIAAGP